MPEASKPPPLTSRFRCLYYKYTYLCYLLQNYEEQSDACANLCANSLLVSYHGSNVGVVPSLVSIFLETNFSFEKNKPLGTPLLVPTPVSSSCPTHRVIVHGFSRLKIFRADLQKSI